MNNSTPPPGESEPRSIGLDFAASLRSELRMPLTAISGYTELLLFETVGPVNERQTAFLSMVQAYAEKATRALDGFVELARIQSCYPGIELEPVELAACVDKVVSCLKPDIHAKGQMLTVQASTRPRVYADPRGLILVLTGLLKNAHMYTPARGQIILTVEQDADFARIAIADTGIGITPEEGGRIFDKFYRGKHPVVQEQFGLGLDLYLVECYVEHFGGQLGLESEPGRGSTFWFTLPLAVD